ITFDLLACFELLHFSVVLKAVENCLPATALHLNRIDLFRVKRLDHTSFFPVCDKCYRHAPTVDDFIFDLAMLIYTRVDTFKIKAEAPVLSSHRRAKLTVFTQVVLCEWCVPIIRRLTPCSNVSRLVPALPYFLDRCVYSCFNGDRFF